VDKGRFRANAVCWEKRFEYKDLGMRSGLAPSPGSHLTAKYCHLALCRLPKLPQLSEAPQSLVLDIKTASNYHFDYLNSIDQSFISYKSHSNCKLLDGFHI